MNRARQVYTIQRHNAARRGIPFLFEFEPWVKWWESHLGPDWLSKRGVAKGKYCMARKGDKGPYEVSNVLCMLATDNLTDAAFNDTIAFGERSGMSVLTEAAARDIFTSSRSVEDLCAHYGISAGTVIDIRVRRTWRRATADLTRVSMRGKNRPHKYAITRTN